MPCLVEMSDTIKTMKAFATIGFERLGRATKDLSDEQLDWKSCTEANSIRWILTHLSYEFHSFIPKIITGDKGYTPEGWPADYIGNICFSLGKIMGDIESGKVKTMKMFDEISEDDLAVEMDWFYGKAPKERYLMLQYPRLFTMKDRLLPS